MHGDQLTCQRIRSVQTEQRESSDSYERRQWMTGVASWFHIQMNLLNTIQRTHFKPPPQQISKLCIEADMATWNRSFANPNVAKFHLLEPTLIQGFNARVSALFYDALRQEGSMTGDDSAYERSEDIDSVIGIIDR